MGNGFTDNDLDELDPSANGICWRCKGSGVIHHSFCQQCEDDFWEEQENEL
jgi:DnaJ-class molecular chaperone